MVYEGLLKLLELRHSYAQFTSQCQGYVDNPFEKERWMLHYDILTTLVDDERIDEDSDDSSLSNIRFLMLEGKSREVALRLQNDIRKMHDRPTQINFLADAVDKVTGDLIELKVTWVNPERQTQYIKDSIKESEDLDTVLIIADTNSCKIFQPTKSVFTKGVEMAIQQLRTRKEVMDKYNMSDNSTYDKITITPLPSFLQSKYNNLNIKDSEFFDVTKSQYRGRTRNNWIQALHRENRRKGEADSRSQMLEDINLRHLPSTSGATKRKLNDDNYNTLVKKAKISKDNNLMENLRDFRKTNFKKVSIDQKIGVINKAIASCEVPCHNREQVLVTRPMNFKEGKFLEEMRGDILKIKLNEIDEINGTLKWKALVPPINQMKGFKDIDLEILIMGCEFEEPFRYSKDGKENYTGFKVLLNELTFRPYDLLGLSSKNLSKIASENGDGKKVLDLFGIGWKEYKQVGENEPPGTSFEFEIKERKGPTGYPFWFNEIREAFAEKNEYNVHVMPTLCRREADSDHLVDGWADHIVSDSMSKLTRQQMMLYCSIVENIYNRLGGMLSTGEGLYIKEKSDGKRQHQNLRIKLNPLENVAYEKNENKVEKVRILWGMVFRGPSHARQPTDTTNLFIVSFFKNFNEESDSLDDFYDMHPNYSFGKVRSNIFGEFVYGIRRYAVRRIDPTYYSFITNAIFEPMNSLGELIFSHLNNEGYRAVNLTDFIGAEIDLPLSLRISENIIIGVNMGNFDEGLMPFVRYEFLNKRAASAGERSFNLNYEEYMKKLLDEYSKAGVTKWLLRYVLDS